MRKPKYIVDWEKKKTMKIKEFRAKKKKIRDLEKGSEDFKPKQDWKH